MKLKHLSSHTTIRITLTSRALFAYMECSSSNQLKPLFPQLKTILKCTCGSILLTTFYLSNFALFITFALAINALNYINHPL